MKSSIRIVVSSLFIVIIAASCQAGDKINVGTLLTEMTDLAGMAEFPSPSYTCKQFSSYDRAAKSPKKNWFANGDCGHFLRTEKNGGRTEFVMMDADGPGTIVRIWSANPTGTIRFYLDGAKEPAWVVPMDKLTKGEIKPLVPPLGGMRARGCNLYFPIPYAKHCKVTLDKGGIYYHINYRTYPRGTEVETFKEADLETNAKKIAKVAKTLSAPATIPQKPLIGRELEPGKKRVLKEAKGPATITYIKFSIRAKDKTAALRHTVLRMTFDGEQTVDVPVGDFFGSAPGINPYHTLPCTVIKGGYMWANWTMPFKKSAKIELINYGKETVGYTCLIRDEPYKWTDRSMLFHAKWRNSIDVSTRPFMDWNYLTATGKGVFAGASYQVANPVATWWGEGDEKIFVDGEKFPSHFGTGTEDYFGYAWCRPELFTHAYHSQSRCDGPGNMGHTSLNRWHIIDRIPFNKSFKFDMELWHWAECNVNLSVTSYWYARPGAKDTFRAVTAEDVNKPLEPKVPRVEGAIEGEKMKIIARVGAVQPQGVGGTSNLFHMWWRGGGTKVGDKLTLGFDVEKVGKYKIFAAFVKANDYGIFKLYINGKVIGKPLDFYNPSVTTTKQMKLGTAELKKGRNTITAEIAGANPKAVKKYMFGLDYLLLKPAK